MVESVVYTVIVGGLLIVCGYLIGRRNSNIHASLVLHDFLKNMVEDKMIDMTELQNYLKRRYNVKDTLK